MTSSLGSLMIIIIIITAITTIMIVSCDSDNDESGDDLAWSEREKEIWKLSNSEFEKKATKYTEDLRRYKRRHLILRLQKIQSIMLRIASPEKLKKFRSIYEKKYPKTTSLDQLKEKYGKLMQKTSKTLAYGCDEENVTSEQCTELKSDWIEECEKDKCSKDKGKYIKRAKEFKDLKTMIDTVWKRVEWASLIDRYEETLEAYQNISTSKYRQIKDRMAKNIEKAQLSKLNSENELNFDWEKIQNVSSEFKQDRNRANDLSKQITSQINSNNEDAIESIQKFVELHETNKRLYDYLVEINENAKKIIANSRNLTSENDAPHHHHNIERNRLKSLSFDNNNNQTFFNNNNDQNQKYFHRHQSVRLKPDLRRRITATTTKSSKLFANKRINFSNIKNNLKSLLPKLLLIVIAISMIKPFCHFGNNESKTFENDDMEQYHYPWWQNNEAQFFWILNAIIIIVIIFAGIAIEFYCILRSTNEAIHNNNNNNNNKCNRSN